MAQTRSGGWLGCDGEGCFVSSTMRHRLYLMAAACLFGIQPVWALYSTNFDALANGTSILTNQTGSGQWMGGDGAVAVVTNGTYTVGGSTYSNYVVFQGEVSNIFTRIMPNAISNEASAQLLTQITWSDALPADSLCPARQGGLCVSNGFAYGWATNGWLRLTNAGGAAVTLPSNTWARLTFVANYTGASFGPPTNTVFYQIFVNGTNLVPEDVSCRYAHGSPFYQSDSGTYIQSSALFTEATKGIQGFYLAGSGTMDSLAVQPGLPNPLSSGIDIRAYEGADGCYVEFSTSDEEGDGIIFLRVRDASGAIIWEGAQQAKGSGTNLYRFLVPGLRLGGTYSFTVIDEAGKAWSAAGITVTSFAADMLRMSPVGVTLQFNSLPDRQYEVQWVRQLGDTWQAVTNLTALETRSSVFVFFPDPAAPTGFFRIVLK